MRAIVVDADLAGGPIQARLQRWVRVAGRLVVVRGDKVMPHTQHDDSFIRMVDASSWFVLNGRGVCRNGDKASCSHPAVASQTWFTIP